MSIGSIGSFSAPIAHAAPAQAAAPVASKDSDGDTDGSVGPAPDATAATSTAHQVNVTA